MADGKGRPGMNDGTTAFENRPRSRSARRALLTFLFASAALHAAVIIGVQGPFTRPDAPALTVLEVVLVQTEAARPARVEPVRPEAAPSPQARTGARVPGAEPAVRPRPKAGPRRIESPVLSLPDPPAAEEVAAAEEKPAAAPPAPAKTPEHVASIAPPTPPSFSAAYLRNPAPRYPVAARRAGEQGTVTLKVLVGMDGLPQRVEVEKTSGSSRLDSAALDAVRRWRFVPARRGSSAIESWVLVPVVFRLESPS
ncbi:MAG TPA: energy transducer TonB [Burkholderiales bacterium]|nr:energy transducer TonB [Burkholderiales bacterium]